MRVRELIKELLEFNLDADIYVHTDYSNTDSFSFSWTSDDCSNENCTETKRTTKCVFIETTDNEDEVQL